MNEKSSNMHASPTTMQLVVIAGLLNTMYLTANIMAVKLINIQGITVFDAGTIAFPVAYMLGDALTEVWGFKTARQVIILSFVCNVLLMFFTSIAVHLPHAEFANETAVAYNTVFSYVPRIVLASLVAFLVGEIANAWSMERIKIATQGKHLWLRAIVSSMLGYSFDTVIFVFLAFYGTAPLYDLSTMIIIQYIGKVFLEAIFATPFIYALVAYLKRRL